MPGEMQSKIFTYSQEAIQMAHAVIESKHSGAYASYREDMPFSVGLSTSESTKRALYARDAFYHNRDAAMHRNPELQAPSSSHLRYAHDADTTMPTSTGSHSLKPGY